MSTVGPREHAAARPALLQDLPNESKRIEPTGLDDWMSYKRFHLNSGRTNVNGWFSGASHSSSAVVVIIILVLQFEVPFPVTQPTGVRTLFVVVGNGQE